VVTVEGDGSSGEALADRLPLRPGERVVLPRADRADDALPARLRERGAHVIGAVAYRSVTAPAASDDLLRAALAAGPLAAVVFTSGSTAQGLAGVAARVGAGAAVQAIPAVCIGHPSARAAIEAGFTVAAVAESPAPDAVAAAVRTVAATHHAELEPRPTTLESR
jgi:uroporphyrinogen-III synthase